MNNEIIRIHYRTISEIFEMWWNDDVGGDNFAQSIPRGLYYNSRYEIYKQKSKDIKYTPEQRERFRRITEKTREERRNYTWQTNGEMAKTFITALTELPKPQVKMLRSKRSLRGLLRGILKR